MKTTNRTFINGVLAVVLVATVITVADEAAAQTSSAIPAAITTPDRLETSLGTLEFKDGAPSKETVAKIYDNLDLMHGVEAFVNAYQGASVAALFKGFNDAGVPDNTAPDLVGADGCKVPVPDRECGHDLFLG
jgi:hypothetical protein